MNNKRETFRHIESALLTQACATLELAEQQRIANLIRLWQGSTVGGEFSSEGTRTLFGEHGHLHPKIAEALGVTPPEESKPEGNKDKKTQEGGKVFTSGGIIYSAPPPPPEDACRRSDCKDCRPDPDEHHEGTIWQCPLCGTEWTLRDYGFKFWMAPWRDEQ